MPLVLIREAGKGQQRIFRRHRHRWTISHLATARSTEAKLLAADEADRMVSAWLDQHPGAPE